MKLSEEHRRLLTTGTLLVAIASIFVVASMVSSRVFEPSAVLSAPLPRAEAPTTTVGASLFRVAAIEGPTETYHNGQWYVVQAGDSLSLQDVIRTPRGSRALLRRGSAEIEVKENVDIRLDQLAETTATFDVLRGGNVTANVGQAKEILEISAGQARTVNQGTARWVVSLGPTGRVSVAATKGEVRFSAAGRAVALTAGTESVAGAGQGPSQPEQIPEDLLLSVVWPELGARSARTTIVGKVSPSSRVKLNGIEADVQADGRFTVSPGVAVGPNRWDFSVEDINGRKKTLSHTAQRPAPTPVLETTGEVLWKR